MVLVTLEDDWRVIQVRSTPPRESHPRTHHPTSHTLGRPSRIRSTVPLPNTPSDVPPPIVDSSPYQVELDTHSSDAEVYYALRKLLRSNKAESHLVCDDLVLTDDNACGLLKAASVVRVVDGPPPLVGRATPPPRGARGSAPTATKPRWLPSQHKAARVRPTAARHSAPAVTAASTGIVVRGMGSADVDSLAASNLSDWIKSYKSEVEGFASTSVNAALRYEEVLAATAGLGAPNAARTRVACQLLDGVVGKFGRYEPIARQLLDEVFVSVFVDPEVREAEPYFLRYAHTMQELRGASGAIRSDREESR